jgi:hypothetical protein
VTGTGRIVATGAGLAIGAWAIGDRPVAIACAVIFAIVAIGYHE